MSGTPSPAQPRQHSTAPLREDCWSEDATFTLIEAWGERYRELNRGNLRQKHWEEVADAVNNRHFNVAGAGKPPLRRTDVQCKNRIDTLKKKYKIEKARVSESKGAYHSSWPFFTVLDDLLRHNSTATGTLDLADSRERSPRMILPPFPVAPRSAIPRRPASSALHFKAGHPNQFHRNLTVFAAAAAAAAASEDDSGGGHKSRSSEASGCRKKRRKEEDNRDSYSEVAEAIERLGEIYERVEEKKRKEMVELEKQRMRFAKELECHRMQLFAEMQGRLQKINRIATKRSSSVGYTALDMGLLNFSIYY